MSSGGMVLSMEGSGERVSASPRNRQKRIRLCRLEQDVALPAERELDDALRCEVFSRQHHLLVRDSDVVDAQAAALDLAPCLAVGGDQACPDEGREHAGAGVEFGAWDV